MTVRSIRRAQERKAKKQARKAEARTAAAAANFPSQNPAPLVNDCSAIAAPHLGPEELSNEIGFSPEPPESSSVSLAQLAANRANALFSTGPNTATGKAKSSLNAVKTGLTGRTVLLPSDDAAEYERHIHAYEKELQPVGQIEGDLVLSIANITWRLNRIPALEMAIFAQGHLEFADAFKEHEPSLRSNMIELQTFVVYEKQLRNLQLQEGRLARRREKETAELRRLQADRYAKEAADRAPNGFEFSTAQSEPRAEQAVAAPSIQPPALPPFTPTYESLATTLNRKIDRSVHRRMEDNA